jgi:hypothetical protein
MPRLPSPPHILALPPTLEPDGLPRLLTRRQMVDIHRFYFGPTSLRTIEQWPLAWRLVNGVAVANVEDFLAEAQRRLEAAPAISRPRLETAA